ncbi:carboxypeptidase-like regulatory domain-containing protein [Pedobacter cryoconitis]|uniref:TonB-dependent SusC/RagA subfamily outer membrane receptor n=1 Tax=Pedobacter cryoconitis TaxID=188932 RepID=A0A327RZ06_9SPHI|nr:carboxypeptidase-like regulatory domain-containing protein [Pedobacter cryoconitis]RAJ22009.1 TonB-dependent SusC/RagA subfamily outer membrane receptor [Pedobacter cryoconitis]
MKTKYLYACLFLLVCAFSLAFRIADDPFETLLKKLADYTQENPQEKVHLHLDKPYYAIGDNIWFKAYVTDNSTDQLSKISQVLYVDLINENDSVKSQVKLQLVSGLTWGDFKLTDTLPEGNYRIRAYTQWMRNAGPDFFFDKTIKIGNAWANKVLTNTKYTYSKKDNENKVNAIIKFTDKKNDPYAEIPVTYTVRLRDKTVEKGKAVTNAQGEISLGFSSKQAEVLTSGRITATLTLGNKEKIVKTIPIKAVAEAVAVQLFPESGNLVEDLPSRIGIKAVGSSGLGEDVTGMVVDNEGTEVLPFKTTHQGMGSFILNPQPGKAYTANIKLKDGSVQQVPFPKVLAAGYVLAVNNADSNKVSAKLLVSQSLLNKGEMRLVIQHNNLVIAVLKASTQKQINALSLNKKELPSGILHFTLFSPENIPVAERLIFINNPADHINLNVLNLKNSYKIRENVPIEFSATAEGKPTYGSFSVAVTNASIVEPDVDNESNIMTSLLLSSDLKGYIEKPNQYFRDNSPQTRENLDQLMLTQGWSRLLWKDVIGNTVVKPVFAVEKSLKVSGIVTTPGGKPIAKGKVTLFSNTGGFFMLDTLTDASGHFNFDNLRFGDSTKFVVQARNAKDKKSVEIKIDKVPGQIVTSNKNTGDIEINVNEAIQSYIIKSEGYFDDLTKRGLLERSYTLNQVNIVQQKLKAKNSANLNGAGRADLVIKGSDLSYCTTLAQCLQGRVPGLTIRGSEAFLARNNGVPMQIILDGTSVGSDFLDNVQPQDIESVEVLKSGGTTAIYGSRGAGGVLIITTRRGGDTGYSTYAPGIINITAEGYYAVREFYSPKYNASQNIRAADKRTTVYWNPNVVTNETGTAKFNFYNTDESGTYRVVIEGMNLDGRMARKVYTYEVK